MINHFPRFTVSAELTVIPCTFKNPRTGERVTGALLNRQRSGFHADFSADDETEWYLIPGKHFHEVDERFNEISIWHLLDVCPLLDWIKLEPGICEYYEIETEKEN